MVFYICLIFVSWKTKIVVGRNSYRLSHVLFSANLFVFFHLQFHSYECDHGLFVLQSRAIVIKLSVFLYGFLLRVSSVRFFLSFYFLITVTFQPTIALSSSISQHRSKSRWAFTIKKTVFTFLIKVYTACAFVTSQTYLKSHTIKWIFKKISDPLMILFN